jgi:MFS family permease
MGYAGDVLGRTKAMTLTLSLVVFGALFSAVASYGTPTEVYITIIVARFILGIGVGGVYPLSATKASEDGHGSHGHGDPTAAAWAFFWQIPGSMVSERQQRCVLHYFVHLLFDNLRD